MDYVHVYVHAHVGVLVHDHIHETKLNMAPEN
jgi:hypothetical protein